LEFAGRRRRSIPPDRLLFGNLPERIIIYRGYGKKNQDGFSWTTDKEKGKYFAVRFQNQGILITGKVPSKKVIAFLMRGKRRR
jgi:hypothetical protein